jgi:hypothetical protein
VDGVRLAWDDLEAAAREQRRDSFRPVTPDERVLVAVDDHSRLLDQRQALLDPVRQDRARRRQEHPWPGGEVVARRQRDQRERLAGGIAQRAEQLVAPAAAGGIDGRPDEHHRPDLLGPADGKLRHDLAAHRVRDEGGADQLVRLDPRAKGVCVLT